MPFEHIEVPDSGERTVVREPTPLSTAEPGVELLASKPLRTDIEFVTPAEKGVKRRRIAERAYGKGWRSYEFSACQRMAATDDGRPHCSWFDCVVNPAVDCGPDCEGFESGESPAVDIEALRDSRSRWVADPEGVSRTQSGLDRFS